MAGIFELATPELIKSPYALVVLGNLLICIQILVLVYMYIIPYRLKTFTKKFHKDNGFDELHRTAFKKGPADMGYPDTGNGRYSMKLPYKEWYKFNCAQRVHMNYIEGFTVFVLGTFITGLIHPHLTFGIQCVYLIGRQLYSQGYMKGAQYRLIGAYLYQLANLAVFVLGFKAAFTLVKA